MPRKSIVIASSLATKGIEVKFLKDLIEQRGHKTILLDLCVSWDSMEIEPLIPVDITCEEVAKAAGTSIQELKASQKRGEIPVTMTKVAIKKAEELYEAGKLDGIVGLGGATNTTVGTEIMKVLPFGVPKLMVSSTAAIPRYAGRYIGSADITMMASVVDMVGLNELVKSVLTRAAGTISGMVETGAGSVLALLKQSEKPLIAVTEFGYAEKCCEHYVKPYLEEKGYEVIMIHAQGVGDRALEKLLDQEIFDGVVEIVPAGVSEELLGGNRAAGPDRLEGVGRRGIPQVVTPCGFEMISCGPLERRDKGDPLWVSRNLANRKYYVHDLFRVQARTSADELRLIAKTVANKLNKAKGPVKFLIPLRGWSALSIEDWALHDPEADKVFTEELRKHLKPEIEIRELDVHINTPEFAKAVVEAFDEMMKSS